MANIKRQQLRAGSRLPTTLPTFHDLSRANALGVDSLARISQQSARYPGGHLKGMNFFRALGHPVVFPRAIASVRPKRARRAAEKCGLTNEKRLRAIVKRKAAKRNRRRKQRRNRSGRDLRNIKGERRFRIRHKQKSPAVAGGARIVGQ